MILTARNPDRLHRVGLEFGASIAAFDATDFDRLERFFDALPTLIDHLLVTGAGPDSKRHAATSTPSWSLPLERCGVEHGVGEGCGGRTRFTRRRSHPAPCCSYRAGRGRAALGSPSLRSAHSLEKGAALTPGATIEVHGASGWAAEGSWW